jgi:hypothetical protein
MKLPGTKPAGDVPPELQAALTHAEELVRAHVEIRDAIAAALRELSEHKEKTGLMELNLCGAESAFALGKVKQSEVTEAQAGFAKAVEARQAVERRLTGLRTQLISSESEQALKAVAAEITKLKVPVVVAAVGKVKLRVSEQLAALAEVVRDARAVEAAGKLTFVDSMLSAALPKDGRPLPMLPDGAIPFGLPGPMPAAGVSDPTLARLVAVEAGLGAALGAIAGERTRRQREKFRAARGPGLFRRGGAA